MEFSPLSIEHAAALGAVLRGYGAKLCDYTFASLYMWGAVYETSVQEEDGIWLLRWREPHTGAAFYTIPHRGAELWRGLERAWALEDGVCTLWGVPQDAWAEITARLGDRATLLRVKVFK